MKKGVKRDRLSNIKLNKILENTTTIKSEIAEVTKEKKQTKEKQEAVKEKKKEQLQKAQDKFVRIGTKLNVPDLEKFDERLIELSLNQSQYIKKLIEIDRDYKFIEKFIN